MDMSNKERSDKDVANIEKIAILKEISERFNNGTETIEDIINYCRNYEITFKNGITLKVVEKKYFDKLIEVIQELEEENRVQRHQIMQVFDRGYIHKDKIKDEYIPKQKVKDKMDELGISDEDINIKYVLQELLEGEE